MAGSDEFAGTGPVAKGLNMLGTGLLLACTGVLAAAMFGSPAAGVVLGLGYAGALGTLGLVLRAAAYGLAAREIDDRGVTVPRPQAGDAKTLLEDLAASTVQKPTPAVDVASAELAEDEEKRGFVAMLEEQERQRTGGKGF